MARQDTTSKHLEPIKGVVLIALVLVILSGQLDEPTQLTNLLVAAAKQMLALLPSLVLTASQILRPDAFDQHFSFCTFHALIFWPLLQAVGKAA
jgi:hypothetical protein